MAFTVLAGVASIMAVPLAGGASLAGYAVTAIGSIAPNAIPPGATNDSMSYSGSTLEGAITAMKSAMAALQQRIETAQAAIEVSLVGNLAFVEAEMTSLFQMAKPALGSSDAGFTPGR